VKFGRQTKEHYLATEIEKGKASGWRADFDETKGVWVETLAPVPQKAKPAKKKAAVKKKATAKKKVAAKKKAPAKPKVT
jgi:hypothetical protein